MCGGVYYLCAAIYTVGVVAGWSGVAELLRIHDLICGHLMFIPLFVLAALQLPDKVMNFHDNAVSTHIKNLLTPLVSCRFKHGCYITMR